MLGVVQLTLGTIVFYHRHLIRTVMSAKEERATTPTRSFFNRAFWMLVGTALVAVGAVALLVPLLPTTPFLLLGAACYAKSSNRFYRLLKRSPMLGDYVRSYERKIPLPAWVLALTIALVWFAVIASSIFLIREPLLQLTLVAVAVTETIVLPLWNRRRMPIQS
jgi:uncharacterized membrane protein YbaN (DUF454 family)